MAPPADDSLAQFSATAVHLLDGCRRNSDGLRRWYASLLNHLCRELEDFAPLNVSEAARDEAKRHGLADLRYYHWDHWTSGKFGEAKALFHWEHFVPVKDLFDALIELPDPNQENVAPILRTATIAWILKKENTDLGRHGGDNLAAYEAKGIKLVYRACGQCERRGGPYECPEHDGQWPPRFRFADAPK